LTRNPDSWAWIPAFARLAEAFGEAQAGMTIYLKRSYANVYFKHTDVEKENNCEPDSGQDSDNY